MPAEIRPTQNVARKATFDLIGHDLSGMSFLDLYAGSGAVGLEALSLGAKQVTFVERAPLCVTTIEDNLRLLYGKDSTLLKHSTYEVLAADVMASIKMLARNKRTYDVVFFDPPYEQGLVKKTLKTIMAYDILQPVSFVIAQHSYLESLPDFQERFSLIRHRKYGKSYLAILERRQGVIWGGEGDDDEGGNLSRDV